MTETPWLTDPDAEWMKGMATGSRDEFEAADKYYGPGVLGIELQFATGSKREVIRRNFYNRRWALIERLRPYVKEFGVNCDRRMYAIHLVPLEHTRFSNDIDDYRAFTDEDIARLASDAQIVEIVLGPDDLLTADRYDPDGFEDTAVFVCDTEAEAREEGREFLKGQRAFAQILHATR